MNHFISDYLSDDKKRKRKDALKEWEILKKLPIPKTYQEWKKYYLENQENTKNP